MSIIKTILEKFKLTELALLTFLVTLFISFIPKQYVSYLQIESFKNSYQTYISLIMIISGVYLFIKLIYGILNTIKNKIKYSKNNAIKYMLNEMSPQEMSLLVSAFYRRDENRFVVSGKISIENGIRTPLEAHRIIYLSSSIGGMLSGFSYNLYPHVLSFLNYNLKKGNIDIENDRYVLEKVKK